MTTLSDDINPRLSAVEARLDGIDTQLTEIRAEIRQMRADHQADMGQMRNEHRADIRQINQTIIAFGSGVIVTMLGLIETLTPTLIFKL